MLHIAEPSPNYYPRMTELARTFPTLDKADGIEPFHAPTLDAWARSGAPCHGARHAARFILAVWSGQMGRVEKPRKKTNEEGVYRFPVETAWRSGLFDVVSALATWDSVHRAAFVAWAANPWWP